mgnify:CR=1 FL=1
MSHVKKTKKRNVNKSDVNEEILKAMKSRDVNVASWLISLLTIAVGAIKLFTEEYFDFFEYFGKRTFIDVNLLGIIMIVSGLLFMTTISKNKLNLSMISIPRISIILVTCSWTYLAFEYLMITIFISTGIVWIMAIGIIAICFYIMVRGDYD